MIGESTRKRFVEAGQELYRSRKLFEKDIFFYGNFIKRNFYADGSKKKWTTNAMEFVLLGLKIYFLSILGIYNLRLFNI